VLQNHYPGLLSTTTISFPSFDSLIVPRSPHCWVFTITFRHTTPGRTPLD